jgi:hypothetical protein
VIVETVEPDNGGITNCQQRWPSFFDGLREMSAASGRILPPRQRRTSDEGLVARGTSGIQPELQPVPHTEAVVRPRLRGTSTSASGVDQRQQ